VRESRIDRRGRRARRCAWRRAWRRRRSRMDLDGGLGEKDRIVLRLTRVEPRRGGENSALQRARGNHSLRRRGWRRRLRGSPGLGRSFALTRSCGVVGRVSPILRGLLAEKSGEQAHRGTG
jgi:hypothetical protein